MNLDDEIDQKFSSLLLISEVNKAFPGKHFFQTPMGPPGNANSLQDDVVRLKALLLKINQEREGLRQANLSLMAKLISLEEPVGETLRKQEVHSALLGKFISEEKEKEELLQVQGELREGYVRRL